MGRLVIWSQSSFIYSVNSDIYFLSQKFLNIYVLPVASLFLNAVVDFFTFSVLSIIVVKF